MTKAASNSKKLTVDQLKEFRVELLQAYETGSNKAEEEFQLGNLTQSQFNDAAGELQKLKIQATKLLGLIIGLKLDALLDTDAGSPASKMGKATDRLKRASQKITDFLEFLQSIAEVIRIASGLIVAIQTGTIAKI